MSSRIHQTEGKPLLNIRAQALVNSAFLRVVRTGSQEQVTVMALRPYGEVGDNLTAPIDQLFVVVDGVGDAIVGDLELSVRPGDLVFVEAGTTYNITNRATIPLRLIRLFSRPVYPPGTVVVALPLQLEEPGTAWYPRPAGPLNAETEPC